MNTEKGLRIIHVIWGLAILGLILGRLFTQGDLKDDDQFSTGEIVGIVSMMVLGTWVYWRDWKKK